MPKCEYDKREKEPLKRLLKMLEVQASPYHLFAKGVHGRYGKRKQNYPQVRLGQPAEKRPAEYGKRAGNDEQNDIEPIQPGLLRLFEQTGYPSRPNQDQGNDDAPEYPVKQESRKVARLKSKSPHKILKRKKGGNYE